MKQLLKELEDNDVFLELDGGKLKVLSSGSIHEDLIQKLKERKGELIEFLTGNTNVDLSDNQQEDIPVLAPQPSYPLSKGQYRIWILSQFKESNIAYNESMTFGFKGNLNLDKLKEAFVRLIDRHEILRTTFKLNSAGVVEQYIGETSFQMRIDKSLRGKQEGDLVIDSAINAEVSQPFDIENGPLLRICIFELNESSWLMTCTAHHIIIDGWSMQIMASEVLSNYNSILNNTKYSLPPLKIQYKDYAAWQNEKATNEKTNKDREFWKNHFQGELSVIDLPSEKIRPAIKTYNGSSYRENIPRELTASLKSLFKANNCTLFMGVLASVKVLIHRYTQLNDIIIGMPIAGREHVDLERQIGLYLNTIALRSVIEDGTTFADFLSQIRSTTLHAYQHQSFPFNELIEELNISRDVSRNPLFDIQVILQNIEIGTSDNVQDLMISQYDINKETCVFDIVFNFFEGNDQMMLEVHYNKDVYSGTMISKFVDHLMNLFESIVNTPNVPIAQLEYLSEAEKQKQLLQGKGSEVVTSNTTILELFRNQCSSTPDEVALYFSGKQTTYAELDQLSSKLATYLINDFKIGKGDCLGVLVNRSDWAIVAILAIMKVGGVYVPIDPEFPESRVKTIIEDTNLNVLLTETEYLFNFSFFEGNLFALDIQLDGLPDSNEFEFPSISADDLAYIIFTSGSTGKPKGVMIEHGAIINTIISQIEFFSAHKGNRHLQFASLSFDASISEIFVALCSGGQLFILNDSDKKKIEQTENFITDNQIAIATIPPTYLELLDPAKISSVRTLITAGDVASTKHANLYSRKGTFINAYGPTETSICASLFSTNSGVETNYVSIGKPIFNTSIYILDENGFFIVEGGIGEICVAGTGLSKGYWKNEELSNEKFVTFRETGEQIYKTGDLGKWLPDGNIQYIGRSDNQVKIRGIRVELGEIENMLNQHEWIDICVVLQIKNAINENELIAYYVSENNEATPEIRRYLSNALPSYMIPSHFVQLDKFELTVAGKIDKTKLRNLHIQNSSDQELIDPSSKEEILLTEIWKECLGKDRIGVRNDFFELGGDSIKVLKIISSVKNKMGISLDISDIYRTKTIENLAEFIVQNEDSLRGIDNERLRDYELKKKEFRLLKERILFSSSIENKDNIEDIYPLSDGELGIIYESTLYPDKHVYHDQIVRKNKVGNFDRVRFNKALELLVQKHSILRSQFNLFDFEQQVHIILKKIDFQIGYTDVSALQPDTQDQKLNDFLDNELENGFDFSKVLWKIDVFEQGNNVITFVFQSMHCLLDRWSAASLITELIQVYQVLENNGDYIPEKLELDYADFVLERQIDSNDDRLNSFWKKELQDVSELQLFTNQEQFAVFSEFMDQETARKLDLASGNLNTSIRNITFLAYLYMLKELTNSSNIVSSYTTNIRMEDEQGDMILGNFLNTVPLAFNFDATKSWSQLSDELNDKILKYRSHEKLSHFKILNLHREPEKKGNGIYDTMFNFVDFSNFESKKEQSASVPVDPEEEVGTIDILGVGFLNTPLYFTINVTGGKILAKAQLSRTFKSGMSAENLIKLYFAVLKGIVESPFNTLDNSMQLICETVANLNVGQESPSQLELLKQDMPIVNNRETICEDIINVFCRVLQVYPVRREDNFFSLGGDSFKALQAYNLLKKNYEFSLAELIGAESIEELGSILELRNPNTVSYYEETANFSESLKNKYDLEDVFPVSGMQHDMIESYEADDTRKGHYHIASYQQFEDENFSQDTLQTSLNLVVRKHPSLRSLFFEDGNGGYFQGVRRTTTIDLGYDDFSELDFSKQQDALLKELEIDRSKPFFINNPEKNLLRVKVYKVSTSGYCLFTSFHHVIIDGWSGINLRNELIENYVQIKSGISINLDMQPNALKEYNLLSHQFAGKEDTIQYWKDKAAVWSPNYLPDSPAELGSEELITIKLEADLVIGLKKTAIEKKVSLKAVFLTSLIKALKPGIFRNGVSIGIVTSGRTNDLSNPLNTIGLFWNMAPFIMGFEEAVDYGCVQDNLIELDIYGRTSGRKLREWIGENLFDVSFNFINFNDDTKQAEPSSAIKKQAHFYNFDKFPYALNVSVNVGSLELNEVEITVTFDNVRFSQEDTKQILNQLVQELN